MNLLDAIKYLLLSFLSYGKERNKVQTSTKSVLHKTLKRIASGERVETTLDPRFSNHFSTKTRKDLAQALRIASQKARA